MIYVQWEYNGRYLQGTDGIYNEALKFYEMKWKNDDYIYTRQNFEL